MLTTGFCKLDRGILKYFNKPYTESEAWIWMITQADYNEGCTYAKVSSTLRQLGQAWGLNKSTVSRRLKKWVADGRIECNYAAFACGPHHGKPHATESATESATEATVITLLNYRKFQSPSSLGATESATESATLLKKEKKRTKERVPDSDESVSPNSRVYNFYVEQKQIGHNRPDWKPTAVQAKQLRANIKVLLEKQGFNSDELLAYLVNFFADEKIKDAGWPWKFFMTDPVRWKAGRESPPNPHDAHPSFKRVTL